jgi:hypothetical protein
VAYTFEAAGLYNGLFVMRDRETSSVWTHYDGTVLTGTLAGQGTQLQIKSMAHTTWERWLEDHPETLVLAPIDEYRPWYGNAQWGDAVIGAAWFGRLFSDTLINDDDRLPGNKLVLGVGVGDEFRAYPLPAIGPLTVIHDELGGHPIVTFLDPASLFGLAFSAVVDGDQREFEVVDGEVYDTEGNRWRLDGVATTGPDQGASLEFVTSFVTEWYGWAAYHPETSIYEAP